MSIKIHWTNFKDEKPLDGQWCVFIMGITDPDTGKIVDNDEAPLLMGKWSEEQNSFADLNQPRMFYTGIAKYATLNSLLNIENA